MQGDAGGTVYVLASGEATALVTYGSGARADQRLVAELPAGSGC